MNQTKSTQKLVAMYVKFARIVPVAPIARIAVIAAIASISVTGNPVFAQDAPASQPAPASPHATRESLRRADHHLEYQVRLALGRAKVDSTDVLVRAKNGKVALIGAVPDQNMIQLAADAASKVAGVTSVKNLLVLSPDEGGN